MRRLSIARIRAQARKELSQLRRDRLTLTLAIVLPLVLLMLFGKSISLTLDNVPFAIQDLDNTPLSRRYIETFTATGQVNLVRSDPSLSPSDILDSEQARVALLIPPQFASDIRRGVPAEVQVLINGNDSNAALGLRHTARAVNLAFLSRLDGAADVPPAVRLQVRLWHNPGLSNDLFFGSGALAMVLILLPALLGGLAAAREHEQGTLIQAYASTLSAPEWLLGKGLPYILMAVVEFLICYAAGLFLLSYRIPPSPLLLALGTLFYVTAAVFFGMMVGNVTGTQSAAIQAVQLGGFLVSMLLSGFAFPVGNIPLELRWISYLLPAKHYVDLVRDTMLRGGGWVSSGLSVLVLLLLAGFFFAVNWRRMRRMQLSI